LNHFSSKIFIAFTLCSKLEVHFSYFSINSFGFKEKEISVFLGTNHKSKKDFTFADFVLISIITFENFSKNGINSSQNQLKLSIQTISE
jgi:hypothetical protein